MGLFAGAGCGKTTLLAEIARNVECDVIVFGLIGERGRELREFLDHELDEQLRAKAVLVCATSDRSSMERARAAFTATALAEGYRREGKRVLLLIDSLTRFARAQRKSAWRPVSLWAVAACRLRYTACCRGWWSAPG